MPKLLVIDDNPDILDALGVIFHFHDIDGHFISDVGQVFDTISSFHPDLILLDILMGTHDGRTICRDIKKNPAFSHIPIILFSAMDYHAASMEDCGMADFIQKPFGIDDLLATIKKYLPLKQNREDIKKQLIQIIISLLGVQEIDCKESASLQDDLGADMRDLLMIFASFEKVFNVAQPPLLSASNITLGDMINSVYTNLPPLPKDEETLTQAQVEKRALLRNWNSDLKNNIPTTSK